ncbi:hypothetical protein AB0F81_11180 [Actinoplanes sp. NPDC024001]|uniref:hypothetical protein n=1 Tax=Actinoplanes sp. NPDC024001 TaxID=3154598 RepID=UPI0033DA2936
MLPNPSVADAPLTALGYALEPTNDWRLSSPIASDPLSGEPLVTLEPGPGRKLVQVQPGAQQQQARPIEKPADRKLLPAADVVSRTLPDNTDKPRGALGGLPVQGVPMPLAGQGLQIANLPVDSVVDGTLFSGLTPAGLPAAAGTGAGTRTPAADERPVALTRTEAQSADFPLLGGIDGSSTVDQLQQRIANVQSDISGLPIGGRPVRMKPARSATNVPASTPPTASALPTDPAVAPAASEMPTAQPDPAAAATPAASATPVPSSSTSRGFAAEVDDPRLHEEPVDGFVGK